MDLKDFEPKSDTVVIELVHPGNGKGLATEDCPFTWEVYANHTSVFKEAQYKFLGSDINPKTKRPFTVEEQAERSADFFAEITKTFDVIYDGERVPATKANAKKLINSVSFISMQITAGLHEELSFTKA